MGYSTRATDWEASGIAQVGGGAGPAAGYFLFSFRSREADILANFVFSGAGIGLGGSAGGASAPDFETGDISWSSITCTNSFSANDLHNCFGRLTTAGAGFAIGYGVACITAGGWTRTLFESQNMWGMSIGVGAGGLSCLGFWSCIEAQAYS
jgi:hypothetical protein